MKSTITDRIQTLAVVIGIGFGIWEFVLHDREAELSKIVLVSDLILSRSSDVMVDAITAISELQIALSKSEAISFSSAVALNSRLVPLKNHFDSWGFCYENHLCDKELAAKYICDDLVVFDSILTEYAIALSLDYKTNRDYSLLLNHCNNEARKVVEN